VACQALVSSGMVTALIGVVGALAGAVVGALLTQTLQRRTLESGRVHEARIEAYRNLAAALMDFRSALMSRWFRENEGTPQVDAPDVYRCRSAAWAAYYQVMLVTTDDEMLMLAAEARDAVSNLKDAATRAELNAGAEDCRQVVGRFVAAGRRGVAPPRRRMLSIGSTP
jgi:hypothetical protein